jgi:lipoprotein NlpD
MKRCVILLGLLAMAVQVGCGKSAMRSYPAGRGQKEPLASRAEPDAAPSSPAFPGPTWARVRGVYHQVKPGETLWRICKTYGVNMQEVAEFNNITEPASIRAGLKIFIPGAKGALEVDPKRAAGPEDEQKISLQKGKFHWPVRGEITSVFGIRDKRIHNGIDICTPKGQSVQAAQEGRVSYAGSLQGYGRIVVIQHAGDYSTVYAHLGDISVKKGQPIKKGDIIGKVGESGNATGPHLHFEIRLRGRPRNPMFYLP